MNLGWTAEGLADPLSFAKDLERAGFTDDEIRLVMRDNAVAMLRAVG